MNFMELVQKRASLRRYDTKPIRREDIVSCLEAARLAPSACNSQPWEFIVVDSSDARAAVARAMVSGKAYSMCSFVLGAQAFVVVVSDKGTWMTKIGNVVRDTKLYLIDIGIACEHFILRATELGIGTCWIGWFNERKVKALLGIPRSKRVDVVIAMGYPPADYQVPQKNRKELKDIVAYR